jgi:two-component system response regulator AtoC
MAGEPRYREGSEQVVVLVDDDLAARKILSDLLNDAGCSVCSFGLGKDVVEHLRTEGSADCILLDVRLPDVDGLTLFQLLRNDYPGIPVILMTGYGNADQAVRAMTQGAYYYFTKPLDLLLVRRTVCELLEKLRLKRQVAEMTKARANYGLIGQSAPIRETLRRVRLVADLQTTVLITGETGTGKELVARAIHEAGRRCAQPFVAFNCAAIPDTLLESELFGYEKGAFTGAGQSKPGKFELADRGTLFLDEIGDLPPALQAKLLRVLEDREVERLGGVHKKRVDVRFVAATHHSPSELLTGDRFRQDLYYRLASFEIRLPRLRDRVEDLPLLVFHFLEELNRTCRRSVEVVNPAVMDFFRNYPWPGNIRELRNVLESAVICCPGRELQLDHLPGSTPGKVVEHRSDLTALSQLEREAVTRALEQAKGNRTAAARLLGISRNQVRYRIKKYGLAEDSEETGSGVHTS